MNGSLSGKQGSANVAFGLSAAFSFITAMGMRLGSSDRTSKVILPHGLVLLLPVIAFQLGSGHAKIDVRITAFAAGFGAVWMERFRNFFSVGWLMIWRAFLRFLVSAQRIPPFGAQGEMKVLAKCN